MRLSLPQSRAEGTARLVFAALAPEQVLRDVCHLQFRRGLTVIDLNVAKEMYFETVHDVTHLIANQDGMR